MHKTLVGPRLRQLRRERGQTQSEMAKALGVSAAYVNLLENNQRSLSVQVLMSLSDAYGVDWRDLLTDDSAETLADLRAALRDPMFEGRLPDLQELRGAIDHGPGVVRQFLSLYKGYRELSDRLMRMSQIVGHDPAGVADASPESVIHDFFRASRNHFPELEAAAERLRAEASIVPDELYSSFKRRMQTILGIEVVPRSMAEMPDTLRDYDEAAGRLYLSDALDHPNRVFQLVHMTGLVEHSSTIASLVERSGFDQPRVKARLRVELANYFAAAVLMPYDEVLEAARSCRYDLDYLAAVFGVSFEQVCHRITTLQREGARGVPFFFLRVDRAGNVTKRFNATAFQLAEYGGACPRWNIHLAFRNPGSILPQFVELPEGDRFLTMSRTVDRPRTGRSAMEHRLVVSLGCGEEHAGDICYGLPFQRSDPDLFTPIGINCHLCPRTACSERAHQPIHLELPIDERRRGQTRYES
ncbi:MAG: short-chain fatty acyl-CoA regulator family protein [Pseudomonadota bacterium]